MLGLGFKRRLLYSMITDRLLSLSASIQIHPVRDTSSHYVTIYLTYVLICDIINV
jgi:hypothetical protein